MAGAKSEHREFDAQLRECGEYSGGLLRVLQNARLGQAQRQTLRRQWSVVQHACHDTHKALVDKTRRRCIDQQFKRAIAVASPFAVGQERLFEYKGSHSDGQSQVLGESDQRSGRDHSQLRMLPVD